MTHRIEISYKEEDPREEIFRKAAEQEGVKIDSVKVIDVYTVDKGLSIDEIKKAAEQLYNPVIQTFLVNRSTISELDHAIEIGFLPGVTDNEGNVAKETIEDRLKKKFSEEEGVYYSRLFLVKGISEEQAKMLADANHNPLIENARIVDADEYRKSGMTVVVPKVRLKEAARVQEVDLAVDDDELQKLGKQGIVDEQTGQRRGPLALGLDDLRLIRDYFSSKNRKPTDVELEALAQTWSEHCKHTIFNSRMDEIGEGIFKRYLRGATDRIRKEMGEKDFCLSVFEDNSGVIDFNDAYAISHKVETHNSPSALDPYGGAITGIVGVNRDTIGTGKGALPIINQYGFCFAEPEDDAPLYRGKDKTNRMLSPKRIMGGVIEGVKDGGNCSGIPCPQGFVYFDHSYKGKPLVYVGTVGLMPKDINGKKGWEKGARSGDKILMIGGRVGKDGIHGATFSSEALDTGSPVGAVQIGDPFTQKKLSDAVIKEAQARELYNSMTDNGAGGLSSSVSEMAAESGGCVVELDKVPLKYPGLMPWETWVSESQERMTLAVPSDKLDEFLELMQKRAVEATVIGEFNDSGKCVVNYNGKPVLDLEMEFLHGGNPYILKTEEIKREFSEPELEVEDIKEELLAMLDRPSICSKWFISTQFDYEVQCGSVLKPLQGEGRAQSETTVTRPVYDSEKSVVLSQALFPRYSEVNAYNMAACAIDAAVKNAVLAGANPEHIALLDNFCWCSSSDPERLWQLKNAAKACYEYATVYHTPFISGKDSMFNDFNGYDENGDPVKISVLPTLLITSIGVGDDVEKSISTDAKFEGDLVYLVGPETKDELGASEFYHYKGELGANVPKPDARYNLETYQRIAKAIEEELVASAIPVNLGGLGVALAKSAIGGMLGMEIDMSKIPADIDEPYKILFSETAGRAVVTIAPSKKEEFEKVMGDRAVQIGTTTKERFVLKNGERTMVDLPITELETAYTKRFGGWHI